MKYFKSLFFTLLALAAVFALSSCDGDKASAPTYTVQVPQFAEGNIKDAKVGIEITEEEMTSSSTVKRFFACRVSPPITGFTEQKIAHGSKINTSLFGNPITLTMTVASNGNFIFEGSNVSEYIKVEISKDNKSFNYVHALILDVNAPGAEDEFDVVIGAGDILSSNHFDSYGTAYYASAGRVARYNFLLHGKENGKMAWFCYDGVLTEDSGVVTFTNASNYQTECIGSVNSRLSGIPEYYVAIFDKYGLDFDSVVYDTSKSDEEKLEIVVNSNGLGDVSLADWEACSDRINGLGFNSWTVEDSYNKWVGSPT